MNGLLNVLKPPGMTSHDVVSFIRRTYHMKRVGHAGTLDPAAAGVLPVALGQATRLLEYLTADDKSYRVELTFGFETDSGDDTGTVINRCSDNIVLPRTEIENAVASFIGIIEQVPPMYSAIKVAGKKMYELAREGIAVEIQPRSVVISNINLIKVEDSKIVFDVTCSKGTYIRSLCIDIGRKLGCLGTMSFLVRTRVGKFPLSDANTLEELAGGSSDLVLPADKFISMPEVFLSTQQVWAFKNGQLVEWHIEEDAELIKVYSADRAFIGIASKDSASSAIRPVKVLSSV